MGLFFKKEHRIQQVTEDMPESEQKKITRANKKIFKQAKKIEHGYYKRKSFEAERDKLRKERAIRRGRDLARKKTGTKKKNIFGKSTILSSPSKKRKTRRTKKKPVKRRKVSIKRKPVKSQTTRRKPVRKRTTRRRTRRKRRR